MIDDMLTSSEANELSRVVNAAERATDAMQQEFHNGYFYDGLTREETAALAEDLVNAAETLVDDLQAMIGVLQPFTEPDPAGPSFERLN